MKAAILEAVKEIMIRDDVPEPSVGPKGVKKLAHEAMPVEELPRGLEVMKKGQAAMKLQVVF